MKSWIAIVAMALGAFFVGGLSPSYAANAAPKVTFKVTSGPLLSGAAVTVKATATDDGPSPLKYRWVVVSQPDGGGVVFPSTFTKSRTAALTPQVAGSYEIKVVAKDGAGKKGSKTKMLTVAASQTMGNGIVEGAEECDDGDTSSSDGCSSEGIVETGWNCLGEPSVCTTTVGDGIIRGAEECDDGDIDSSDGCSSEGLIESGWDCFGEPSVCMEFTAARDARPAQGRPSVQWRALRT